jgi:hypothetical protein
VSPNVSVVHEVGHREHGQSKSTNESLSADDGEGGEGHKRSKESILEASNLPFRNKMIVLFQVALGNGGDVRIVNHPVYEFTLLSPRRTNLSSRFLEVGLLWFA